MPVRIALAAAFLWAAWRDRAALLYLARPSSWDSSAPAAFLGGTVLPSASAAAFLWASWGLGLALLRRAGLEGLPAWRHAAALALGVGAAACVCLAAGLAGLWPGGLWAAAGLVLLGVPEALRSSRRPGVPSGPFAAGALAALSLAAWHAFANAAAPAVGWDARAYHLAIPELYLRAGGLVDLPWLLHARWPHLMETLYALPLSLGLEPAAALLHAGLAAALAFAVFQALREEDERAAWGAAAALAAQPVLLEVAGEPHADAAVALLHLCAALGVWRWTRQGGARLLAFAGALSGLAAACKLPALALTAGLAVWVLLRGGWRPAGIFLLTAAAPVAPWLLRAWLTAGNPVWPFAARWLGGALEPERVAEALRRTSAWSFPRDAALLPRYGPHWLLAPLAVLAAAAARRRLAPPPLLSFLLLTALPLLLAAVRYHEAWRFCLPILPALAMLAAWWASRLAGPRGVWPWLVLAATLVPLAGASRSNELFALSGARSTALGGLPAREAYLARQLPFLSFHREAGTLLPAGSRTLFFREVRGYGWPGDYLWGDPVLQTLLVYERLGSPEALAGRLSALRVTHVLVDEGNGLYGPNEDYYSPRTLALMEETLRRCATPLLERPPRRLWSLLPACAPPR